MSVIWLVDDDPAILRALERLLGAEGFETRSYLDAASFLYAHDPALPGCAVIDLGLQTTNGLALQEELEHDRSEEHTSELQSRQSIAYAGFCL